MHKNSKNNHKKILRRTFILSTKEGMFSQLFNILSGLGSMFLTKLLVFMGATSMQLAIYTAISQLSQIFQPIGVLVSRKLTSRKKPAIIFMAMGRIIPFFFGFLPLFFPLNQAIVVFLLLYFISSAFQAISTNLWTAWIGELVPLSIRGRFFSIRSQYAMVSGLLCGYFFGGLVDTLIPPEGKRSIFARLFFFLDAIKGENRWYVFVAIFTFAIAFGLIALVILGRQPEKHKEIENDSSMQLLFRPFNDRNFRRLILFGIWWMLAIGIGSPYWQPFMIDTLKMTLVEMQIYGTCSAVASFFFIRAWGRFVDRFGNKATMAICIVISSLNPLPWLFVTEDSLWLIYIEGITSGIMWSGSSIVIMNFVLAIAPKGMKQSYSGMNGAVSGVGMMLTSLLSGIFHPASSIFIFGKELLPAQILFALTAIARFSALIPLYFIYERKSANLKALFSKKK